MMRMRWSVEIDDDGQPGLFQWQAATREMSDEEIDSLVAAGDVSLKIASTWKKRPRPVTEDWQTTAQGVEFMGDAVASVSIATIDWERDYLARASTCNDNRARREEFAALIAS
jgi:hypothetical protein